MQQHLSTSWALVKMEISFCPTGRGGSLAINSDKRRVGLCQQLVNEVFCLHFMCVKIASDGGCSPSPKLVPEQSSELGCGSSSRAQHRSCAAPSRALQGFCHFFGCKVWHRNWKQIWSCYFKCLLNLQTWEIRSFLNLSKSDTQVKTDCPIS